MSGHIRRQGKGSWELKYDLGTDPVTGKRRTRYRTFKGTKREAEKELTRLLNEKNQGAYIEPSKMTLAEYLDYWLENYAQGAAGAKTRERWTEIIQKHLVPAMGAIPLKELAPLHIQGHYTKALEKGRRGGKGGLSAQTIKHHHAVLFQSLKQAVAWRLLAINPAGAVTPPKIEAREIEFLTREELAELLNGANGTPLHTPLLVLATTGLRRGELLALRWTDVDLDRGLLTVNQSLEETKDGLRFKSPKTTKGRRSITLPQMTGAALHAQAFKRLVGKLKTKPVTLHGLRHTHISHLLMDGVHVKVVSERAGHSNVSITLDRYSHVIPNMQEDAAMIVDTQLRELLV